MSRYPAPRVKILASWNREFSQIGQIPFCLFISLPLTPSVLPSEAKLAFVILSSNSLIKGWNAWMFKRSSGIENILAETVVVTVVLSTSQLTAPSWLEYLLSPITLPKKFHFVLVA
jgi:hypothetical protein